MFTIGRLTDQMMLIKLPSSAKTSDIWPKSASKSGGPTTHEHIIKIAKSGVNILRAVMPRVAGGDELS